MGGAMWAAATAAVVIYSRQRTNRIEVSIVLVYVFIG